MKLKGLIYPLVLLFIQLQTATAAEETSLPEVAGRVVDHAGIISPSQGHLLHQISSQHEFLAKQRIAVVTIESCGEMAPQAYAEQLHRSWDNEKRDMGVLLVLYKRQRSAAVAVGEGLKGKLTKEAIAQIVGGEVTTKMQAGAYDEAAMAGVQAVLNHL